MSLSPILFSIFTDDLIYKVIEDLFSNCVRIVLFADDILLVASTVTGLQRLFNNVILMRV